MATAPRPGAEFFGGLLLGYAMSRAARGRAAVPDACLVPQLEALGGRFLDIRGYAGFDFIPMHATWDEMEAAALLLEPIGLGFGSLRRSL